MNLTCKSILVAQLVLLVGTGSPNLMAQPASVESPRCVAYRLKQAKTLHFDDARKAQLHLDTVKQLGCEAKLDDHGGHKDVVYRVVTWKALTLANENTAHQWEAWMKKAGFETLHAHGDNHDHSGLSPSESPVSHAGHQHGPVDGHFHGDGHDHGHASQEIIKYSLPNWTNSQPRDQAEADELIAVLKGLGCELQYTEGTVAFRCLQPMHLEFPSHQIAIGWEDWMNRTGFRTEHTH